MNYPNGADDFAGWIKAMPALTKATAAILVVLGLGFALADYRGLPGRVEANESAIQVLDESDSELTRTLEKQDRQLQRIICHLEQQRREYPEWESCEQ